MNQASIEPKQKSKIRAFLIAVSLGPMGFHNFYLGRWKRGLTQFGVVFLTLGVGILITFLGDRSDRDFNRITQWAQTGSHGTQKIRF